MNHYLDVDHISVWYDRVRALCDVSLQVEEGEFFTLLGPSGCGKSTLLHSVAGFVPPRAGAVRLAGADITALPPHRREFGMVFQSYALFPHKTVFDNVAYPLQIRKTPQHEVARRVREMLARVALEHAGARRPHELSGGQQQRVALARALSFGPRLLLLDEPFGALDKKLRDQMQIEIRQIQRASQATALFVTHDQAEAMAISDRIAVMRAGRVEQVGAPQAIYEAPANAFVADFVGGANFLEVTVQAVRNGRCAVACLGQSIEGVPAPSWTARAGQRAVLFARPEHLRLAPAAGADGLTGRVESALYLGTARRFALRLPNGARLEVLADQAAALRPGAEVRVGLAPERARLFDEPIPDGHPNAGVGQAGCSPEKGRWQT